MATRDDAEVRAFVEELDMGDWAGEPLDCGTDKAWDAIHRCLSDGTLGCGRRLSPLDMTVLGGGHHHDGDDYIVAHLRSSSPSTSDRGMSPYRARAATPSRRAGSPAGRARRRRRCGGR